MPYCFKVASHKFVRYFYAETQEDMLEWIGACAYWAEQGLYNRYGSYSSVREVRGQAAHSGFPHPSS